MSGSEIVFVPKLGFRTWAGIVAGPILFALGIVMAVAEPRNPKSYLVAGFFGLCTVTIPFWAFRRIRFGQKVFVDRYLLPPKEYEYTDIVDIGMNLIRTKRGNISLYRVENVDELHAAFEEATRRGLISETQIEGKLAGQETVAWIAATCAFVLAIVANIAAISVPLPWLRFDPKLRLLVFFLILFFPVYLCVRWYLKRPGPDPTTD